jgi:putative oxidoreductase
MDRPVRSIHNPDLGLLIIRLMLAAIGIFHGSQKLFGAFGGHGIEGFAQSLDKMGIPLPVPAAWLTGLSELAGGILIGIGLWTRIAPIPWAISMLVAFFVAHQAKFDSQKGGGEYALTLAAVLIALVFTGPGRYSVEAAVLAHEPLPRPT